MRATLSGLWGLTLLLCGCTSIEAGDGSVDGQRIGSNSRLLIGIVHVKTHERPDHVVGWQTGVIGAEIGQRRLLLGIAGEARFEADPAKCQVVIVLTGKADLASAENLVKQFNGSHACIAPVATY